MAEKLKFRALRADEVEVRVGTVSPKGCSLLLYKDARCDMSILDETVGPLNWKREHSNENANCTVSIFNEKTSQWISKEDTGTESFTEKEKGLASDSFKRACVNWGIGRELYTAPFIWFSAGEVNLADKNGKKTTYDRFSVSEMEVVNGRITKVTVVNETTKTTKTFYGKALSTATATTKSATAPATKKSAPAATKTSASASKPATSKPAPAKTSEEKVAPATSPAAPNPTNLGSYRITTECSRKGMTLDELFAADEQAFLKRVVQFGTPDHPAMQADAAFVKPFLESKGISLAS